MQFRLGHIPTLKVLSTWNSEFILYPCMEVQYVVRIVWHHRKSLDAKTEAERCYVLLEPFFLFGRPEHEQLIKLRLLPPYVTFFAAFVLKSKAFRVLT